MGGRIQADGDATSVQWYVWTGEYMKDAMKSWGLPTVIVVWMLTMTSMFMWKHGDAYVASALAAAAAQSGAAQVMADSVTELAKTTRELRQFQEKDMRVFHAEELNAHKQTQALIQAHSK